MDNSEWEVVTPQNMQSPIQNENEWEVAPVAPDSMQPQQNESRGMSALKALPRIGEDLYKKGYNVIHNIPQYASNAWHAGPSIARAVANSPGGALKQGLAGFAEMGQETFNIPHDLVNYGAERLHLVPEEFNRKMQMARMPDQTKNINDVFGTPQNQGEADLRWLGRNSENILGAKGLASAFNPLRLTERGIVKNVLKSEKRQVEKHTNMYDGLWKDAQQAGINTVPVDRQLVQNNLQYIKKYKSPREYQSIDTFTNDPTLSNAQKAASDMKAMKRSLDEKSRSNSLTSEEKNLYNSIDETLNHVESKMFLNQNGVKNTKLANRYKKISASYRDNVVPYKYNPNIQDYKAKGITKGELVQSLGRGEFAAKKGWRHPSIALRKALGGPLGTMTAAGLGAAIYDIGFGKKNPAEEEPKY